MRVAIRHFIRTSLLLGSMILLVPIASGAELAPDAPQTYVVRSGDTLWDIAGRFLRDPWLWPEVWQANPGVGDPDLIYPGDVLELTMVGGEPRIRARRGAGPRVVRLTPHVRSSPLSEAVPTIRISSIGPFLTRPYVADAQDIKRAPYVVGFPDEHLIAGVGDSIYVRRITTNTQTAFQILRPGDELRDPDSNELLGYEAVFVADAQLERIGDPAKLKVVSMERQVSIGDRVIPGDAERRLENFFPHPAPEGLRGRIISVLNGVSQIGPYDVVVINRGTRDGIEPGHVFETYIGGTKERDMVKSGAHDPNWRGPGPLSSEFWFGSDYEKKGWRADEPDSNAPFPLHMDFRRNNQKYFKPFEQSGVLMVFRSFERVSFGVILKASHFINVGDWIASPPS
ncbi:LysM peptidoglycan-binding domain-containing protein [Thiorhodococcus fuscus]|uniref:LysM peptidoglycan-binding domain-containing protein n=1 Tax=Thiorhodococcus fuscus TaxID=527200 RepID=A0ABW4Y876_9GAMM